MSDQYPPPQGQYPPYAGGQYPPPAGGYPPPPGGYPGGPQYWQEPPRGRGLAITALVLGILAVVALITFFGAIVLGLLALAFGIVAAVKARRRTAGGFGMAIAGLILGVLALVGAVAEGVVGYGFFVDHGGRDYWDCLRSAGDDQAQIQQCQDEFEDNFDSQFSVTPQPTP